MAINKTKYNTKVFYYKGTTKIVLKKISIRINKKIKRVGQNNPKNPENMFRQRKYAQTTHYILVYLH